MIEALFHICCLRKQEQSRCFREVVDLRYVYSREVNLNFSGGRQGKATVKRNKH